MMKNLSDLKDYFFYGIMPALKPILIFVGLLGTIAALVILTA